MNRIQEYIKKNEEGMMNDLFSLIRIPSISALPEHKDDMMACAQRWKQLLLEAGADEGQVRVVGAIAGDDWQPFLVERLFLPPYARRTVVLIVVRIVS